MKKTVIMGGAAAAALALILAGCAVSSPKIDPAAVYFQDGVQTSEAPDFSGDVKEVLKSADGKSETFTDYPKGYRLTFPADMTYDLTLAEYVVVAKTENFSCTASVERSPYADVDEYLAFYQNRFYTNEHFREQNKLELLEDTTIETAGLKTRLITVSRENFGVYTYAYQYTGGQNYMRYLFQTDVFDEDYAAACRTVLGSYKAVQKRGVSVSTLKGWPAANPNWSPETAALYKKYQTKTDIDWGIFTADVYDTGINETIPALEEKIGIPFEVVLMYQQLGIDVPVEALRAAHDDGKIIELTIQVSAKNNEDVYGYSPVFDLIQGGMDEDIRRLASQIKDFGLPILFRLNNEMNSDWTSYCGIVTFSDPEIYKAVWRHVYDVFEAEGVNNCIWVFNPNDNDYPPSNWNNFTRYYPGDGYVQMIGVTGYNTGTYYRHVTGETWREFDEIYGEIDRKYSQYFNWFPWIITEFGSSSVGGDKVGWIDRMFDNIGKYKNIKVAVWFSYADFDTREGKNGAVARPYWLDETPDTLAAFARGRAKLKALGESSTSLYPQGPFEETESAWRGVVIGRFKKEDVTWLLGAPGKVQGKDLIYGDTVYTLGDDGYVEKIEITGGTNTTDLRGISIGDTRADIAAKFPQAGTGGDIAIVAAEGSPTLEIRFENDTVKTITLIK